VVTARVAGNSICEVPEGGIPRTALSLLRLDQALDPGDVHLLVDLVDPRGIRYSTYGFPAKFTERGVGSRGTFADVTQDGEALFTLRGETAPAVTHGFSGAPVSLATGEVAGLVAAARTEPDLAIAYSVPSRTIAAFVNKLLPGVSLPIRKCYPQRFSHVPDLLDHFEAQSRHSDFDLRLGLAKTYDGLTGILNPKSWSGSTPKIDEAYPAGAQPASRILDVLVQHPRLRLQSPGGSGKTTFLAGAVKACVDAGRTVFFLDLSRRVDPHATEAQAIFDMVSVGASYGQVRRALEQEESGQVILFVDGLNEQSATADVLVKEIEQWVRADQSKACLVLAGRMKVFGESLLEYHLACIRPLPAKEIRKALGSQAPARPHPLLATPFFLDLRLKREAGPADEVRLKSDELEAYLRRVIFEDGALEALSLAAWNVYSKRSLSAPEQVWTAGGLDTSALNKYVADGLMTHESSEEGTLFQFRHQLIHDYLVSRRLARMDAMDWRAPRFDDVTLEGSSFDALALAAEQIDNDQRLIEFLREMYDWNYRAVLYCLNTLDPRAVKQSTEIGLFRDAVYALNCLRLFDRFSHTAVEMRAARASFRGTGELFPSSMCTEADLLRSISANFRPVGHTYYEEWKKLFLRKRPITPEDLPLLWEDPFFAWTAANVFRRIGVGDNVVQGLKRDYLLVKATAGHGERGVASRWRFVHVMGGTRSATTLGFLFDVVRDRTEDTWVRYGAVRSWVECLLLQAARADRKRAIEDMCKAIDEMRERRDVRVLVELLKCESISPDHKSPKGWSEDFLRLHRCSIEAAQRIGEQHQARVWAESLAARDGR